MVEDEYDYLFKIMCLGDENTGKKSTVSHFAQGFIQKQPGVEFSGKTFVLFDGEKVKLQIWVANGQERYQYIRPMHYHGTAGALIFFDISNRISFEHVPKWIEELFLCIGEIPILVVGNLMNGKDERKVSIKEAKKLALKFRVNYKENDLSDLTSIKKIFYALSCLMIGIDIPAQYRSYKYDIDLIHPKMTLRQEKIQKFNREDRQLAEIERKYERMLEKIKKMLGVSNKIRLSMMRKTLQLSEFVFNEIIWDWAKEFSFEIDGDFIIIKNSNLNNFIINLDKQFELWRDTESRKVGKIYKKKIDEK